MPTNIGPFSNVPTPGDGVTSAWAQQLTLYATNWARGPFQCTSATRPTGAYGLTIFETDTKRLLTYDGNGWVITMEPPQPFTVTPRQNSVAVAYTPQSVSVFQRSGGWCKGHVQLNITGAGTVSTPFDCALAGLPNVSTNTGAAAGPFAYYDSGNAVFVGMAQLANGAAQVSFAPHGSNWTLGGNPSFAAANGDTIVFSFDYEMASRYS